MCIDAGVRVQPLGVAIRTGNLVGVVHADGNGPAADQVVFRPVAVDTLKVVAAHVDVERRVRKVEAFVQVAVFDGVPAAAAKMAAPAVVAGRQPHALRGGQQVDALGRQAALALPVNAALIMADQAVYVGGVFEVEVRILPAVTGVTGGAARPVALDADAEIVDRVLLADRHRFRPAFHRHGIGLPAPMRRVDNLVGGLRMALQARLGHFLTRGERLFEQDAVIDRFSPPRHEFPGRVGNLARHRFRWPREIPGRHGNQEQYEDQAGNPTVAGVFHVGSEIRVRVGVFCCYFSSF
jgi:hypothetical protein